MKHYCVHGQNWAIPNEASVTRIDFENVGEETVFAGALDAPFMVTGTTYLVGAIEMAPKSSATMIGPMKFAHGMVILTSRKAAHYTPSPSPLLATVYFEGDVLPEDELAAAAKIVAARKGRKDAE